MCKIHDGFFDCIRIEKLTIPSVMIIHCQRTLLHVHPPYKSVLIKIKRHVAHHACSNRFNVSWWFATVCFYTVNPDTSWLNLASRSKARSIKSLPCFFFVLRVFMPEKLSHNFPYNDEWCFIFLRWFIIDRCRSY